ncbi:unnamed protein product [Spirodela intermedia]|uniref:Uncharacterized protein n=1 Tax=Spirodela intermedia TaxID=51605 RepID=A0A811G7F9_SPIIN|nr:unnamed protein product [Spirodela intermedia]
MSASSLPPGGHKDRSWPIRRSGWPGPSAGPPRWRGSPRD